MTIKEGQETESDVRAFLPMDKEDNQHDLGNGTDERNALITKSPSTSALNNGRNFRKNYDSVTREDRRGMGEFPTSREGRHEGLERLRKESISQAELARQTYQAPAGPFMKRLMSGMYPLPGLGSTANGLYEFHHMNSSTLTLANQVLDSGASVYSIPDLEEQQRRLSVLRAMRSQRLIGNYKKLANWMDHWMPNVEKIRNKRLRKYYEEQNHLIERFQEIDNLLDYGKVHLNMLSTYNHTESHNKIDHYGFENITEMETTPMDSNYPSINSKSSRSNDIPQNVIREGAHFLKYDAGQEERDVFVAIMVNFLTNFILLIGKLVVFILTSSMSVVASLVDSILDFLSTFIIFIANKVSNTKSWNVQYAYPVGRSRLEPLGVLVFSIIIIISFFQVGQEALKKLFFTKPEERIPVRIGYESYTIMTITILVKSWCWIWCSKSKSSSVQALAQDAKSDVVFNTFSILLPALGYQFGIWWFDPLGALLLSAYIIVTWAMTAFSHIDNLTGAAAGPLEYKVVLYLCYRFAESIKQITALKVYHVGDNLNVEIDLVFNYEGFDMSFKDTHDIGEALQYAIESLPMVERAYVHIDYMEGNFKGHLQ